MICVCDNGSPNFRFDMRRRTEPIRNCTSETLVAVVISALCVSHGLHVMKHFMGHQMHCEVTLNILLLEMQQR